MRITRRRAVAGSAALAAGAGAAGLLVGRGATPTDAGAAPLPPAPDRDPRQHAWDAVLRRDERDEPLPPRHQRLLLCRLAADPTAARAATAEAALRRVERALPASPDGLLLTVGWGHAWFRRIGIAAPIPRPAALNDAEVPRLDDPVCVLHLASDRVAVLDAVERALLGGGALAGAGGATDLRGLLRLSDRRTGFVGAGLPERHRRGTVGLPPDRPLPPRTPLYMGFQSGFRRNQAREEDVTIADGPWAGGTTMHLSTIALALDSWYRSVDADGRARRMFTATTTAADLRRDPRGPELRPVDVARVARRHAVVGHAEAAAGARRDGRPRIIRRDFDSADGGAARVHFVALARSIEDFVVTRQAMDARVAVGAHPAVGVQVNNGINEWMTVEARTNLLLPPRARRVCPGLPGWSA
ncbi:DUF7405 family protein [Patulibacter defluvii]|uniref:DUF7405 family protein n=1 Tax=Patulibacter defluvii TaxID=3095358 RepID=UPI002A747699|nr:hypothetical protein [Patulibacter sp. DM4]